jgi:hypothetical protein
VSDKDNTILFRAELARLLFMYCADHYAFTLICEHFMVCIGIAPLCYQRWCCHDMLWSDVGKAAAPSYSRIAATGIYFSH